MILGRERSFVRPAVTDRATSAGDLGFAAAADDDGSHFDADHLATTSLQRRYRRSYAVIPSSLDPDVATDPAYLDLFVNKKFKEYGRHVFVGDRIG